MSPAPIPIALLFRERPAMLACFDRLADEYGPQIEAAVLDYAVADELGLPRNTCAVRYIVDAGPIGLIYPDGSLHLTPSNLT